MSDIDQQLFVAAQRGAVDDVVALLKEGANAKAVNFMSVTALMAATLKGHLDCVVALLSSSDVNAVDEEGCSALIYACQHGRLNCAKALLSAGDVGRKDFEGSSALDHAKGWGDMELTSLIESYELAQSEARELSLLDASNFQSLPSSRL
ncbi:ankyrin repeat domain-containing protein [Janthinobacterium sp. LB3P112]|uniref:ankyrin repeat domain-containing protein n=1 Tax=Janthinobacterium sp. LB3P112 TaxID=3424196 RepID=UPI003F225B18